MTTLEELTERIGRINGLLEKPEPGLISWQMMLAKHMKELVEWWTQDDD